MVVVKAAKECNGKWLEKIQKEVEERKDNGWKNTDIISYLKTRCMAPVSMQNSGENTVFILHNYH